MFRTVTGKEAKEDLFYGQIVIIVARWFLIVGGVGLALWSARSIADVTVPIVGMAVLTAMNFFLHGRYLMKEPVNQRLVYLSSAIDLGMIIAVVLFWSQAGGSGFENSFFVFLYPSLLAFALVFPPRIALTYAVAAVLVYTAVVLPGADLGTVGVQKSLVERLVTLLAAAGLGTYFWRIQRGRRDAGASRAALLGRAETMTQAGALR
jgi:hypothetical protein